MDHSVENKGSYPPWSSGDSLNEICSDAGIDFDQFICSIELGLSNREMAERFQLSEAGILSLKEHFYQYGIGSVIGGD